MKLTFGVEWTSTGEISEADIIFDTEAAAFLRDAFRRLKDQKVDRISLKSPRRGGLELYEHAHNGLEISHQVVLALHPNAPQQPQDDMGRITCEVLGPACGARANLEIGLYVDPEGAEHMLLVLERVTRKGVQDHDHLMTESWIGPCCELSEERVHPEAILVNHVRVCYWPDTWYE